MKTFKEALEEKQLLENNVNKAAERLEGYPSGNMGLTPDNIKRTPEWQSDRRAFSVAIKEIQTFNRAFLKIYKKEYMKLMREKRFAK